MKRIITLLVLFAIIRLHSQSPLISQYYEGASNDKWIEIVNPYSTSITLTGYYLALFANTAADSPETSSPNATIALTGTLNPGATLLFKNTSAVLPSYASGIASGVCAFNGDDLVIITTSNTGTTCWANRTDVIGDGTTWGADISFYRNLEINNPNTTYTTSEWTSVSIAIVNSAAPGTTEYLGFHGMTALPIKILNFYVQINENQSLISWMSSSETNNSHFLIEWSRDTKNFEPIAKINGKGTTQEIQNYSYIHENPAPGTNYYRLTQVDLDGRKETFPVKSVYFASKEKGFTITPTLAKNDLKFEFDQPVSNGRMLIYNLDGQLINSYILSEGIEVLRIDISDLSSGQYIAKYIDGEDTISKKFVKQ